MSRGLGQRQRQILDALREAGEAMPLWQLADDPDDPNEMAKARSAVVGLERRGLVEVWQDQDPKRRSMTARRVQRVAYNGDGFKTGLELDTVIGGVTWHGMWVELP